MYHIGCESSLVGGSRRETSVNESPCIGPCYSSKLQLAGEIPYSEKVVCDFAACFKGESPPQYRYRGGGINVPPSLSGGDQEISMAVGLSATAITLIGALGTVATTKQKYSV